MMTATEIANLIRTGMGLTQVDSAQAAEQLDGHHPAETDDEAAYYASLADDASSDI